MLVLPLKPGVIYDLGEVLGRWLDSDMEVSFGTPHKPMNPLQYILPKPMFKSHDCRNELLLLQSLRTHITTVLHKQNSHKAALNENCLQDCYEYHSILLEFEKRGFPTIDDETIPIYIPWKQAFIIDSNSKDKKQQKDQQQQQHRSETHSSLVWERSVIMYNIVALLTEKASYCSKTDRDECKECVSLCQLGATIISILKELVTVQDYTLSIDMCLPMLSFWEKLLLAEAQYNIFRMASLNNTSTTNAAVTTTNSTLAMLAQSGHVLFNDALQSTQEPRIQSEVDYNANHIWGPYCKTVSMILVIKAEFHQSIVYRMKNEYGQEIAQLRSCKQKLDQVRKFLQSFPSDTDTGDVIDYEKREIATIYPIVCDRFHEIDQDNYKIYQYKIPESVPDILPKQLAKINTCLPNYMIEYTSNTKSPRQQRQLFPNL